MPQFAHAPSHACNPPEACYHFSLSREQYLSENGDLIEAAHEKMCLGRLHESLQYQLQLQQNLIFLATHADEDPSLERLVFRAPPPAQQQPAHQPPHQQHKQQPSTAAGGVGGLQLGTRNGVQQPSGLPAPDDIEESNDAVLDRMLEERRQRRGTS